MNRPISLDLRERAMARLAEGQRLRQVAAALEVAPEAPSLQRGLGGGDHVEIRRSLRRRRLPAALDVDPVKVLLPQPGEVRFRGDFGIHHHGRLRLLRRTLLAQSRDGVRQRAAFGEVARKDLAGARKAGAVRHQRGGDQRAVMPPLLRASPPPQCAPGQAATVGIDQVVEHDRVRHPEQRRFLLSQPALQFPAVVSTAGSRRGRASCATAPANPCRGRAVPAGRRHTAASGWLPAHCKGGSSAPRQSALDAAPMDRQAKLLPDQPGKVRDGQLRLFDPCGQQRGDDVTAELVAIARSTLSRHQRGQPTVPAVAVRLVPCRPGNAEPFPRSR